MESVNMHYNVMNKTAFMQSINFTCSLMPPSCEGWAGVANFAGWRGWVEDNMRSRMTWTLRLHNELEQYGGRERLVKSDTWIKRRIERAEQVQSWVKDGQEKKRGIWHHFSQKNTRRQTTTVMYFLLTKSIVLCESTVSYRSQPWGHPCCALLQYLSIFGC